MLDALNRFIALFVDTFRQFGRGSAWLPLVLFYIILTFALVVLVRFAEPFWFGAVLAWLSLFEAGVTLGFQHYPDHYLLLPQVFGYAKLALQALLAGFVLALVARQFARAMASDVTQPTSSVRLWLHGIMVWILLNGLLWLAGRYLPELLGTLLDGPRRLLVYQFIILPGISTLILAPLFYAIPAIALHGDSIGRALGRSLRTAAGHPISTLLLAAMILSGPVLFAIMAGYSPQLIERFRPELVAWVLGGGLFAELVASFFWMSIGVQVLLRDAGRRLGV